jgi:2,4-dichlorophenol 6-monooxygenase
MRAGAGARASTLDLVAHDGLTLLCGRDAGAWERAARALGSATNAPVSCVVEGRDFEDRDGAWSALCSESGASAVLVRPDQHVGWYARGAGSDCTRALRQAVGVVGGDKKF